MTDRVQGNVGHNSGNGELGRGRINSEVLLCVTRVEHLPCLNTPNGCLEYRKPKYNYTGVYTAHR